MMTHHLNIIKKSSSEPVSWCRGDNKKSGKAFRRDILRPNPEKAIHIENVKEYTKEAGIKQ